MTHLAKSKLDSLDPEMFQSLTPAVIAKQFKMHVSAVYKHMKRHGIKRKERSNESVSRDEVQAQEAGGASEGSVGERVVATDDGGEGSL